MSTAVSAVMCTIGEIAERDSVSKQSVSAKVKSLIEQHGLAVERDGRGRVARVNVAQYDHLREKFGNAIRAQAPDRADASRAPLPEQPGDQSTLPGIGSGGDSLNEAQTKRAWIEAERAELRLAEDRSDLLRLAGVIETVGDVGIEIARIIDRLPQAADDLAAAVTRDGVHGLRVELKKLAQKMREEIAGALAAIAGASPETEGPHSDSETPPAV